MQLYKFQDVVEIVDGQEMIEVKKRTVSYGTEVYGHEVRMNDRICLGEGKKNCVKPWYVVEIDR